VLPRSLDDATFATLNQMIQSNNTAIITSIRDDTKFMNNLFTMINSNDTPLTQLRDGVKFLQEYNTMAKAVANNIKNDVYAKLCKNGIFEVIESKLRHSDETIRHICAELLFSLLTNNSSQLRDYIVSKKDNEPTMKAYLLESIVHGIVDEPELGIQDTLTEVLKVLLDPDALQELKDTILDLFYSTPIDLLVAPLSEPERFSTSAKIHTLDVISNIVQHHGYRSKNYIIKHDIMKKALDLLNTAVQKDLILGMCGCVLFVDVY
jgi:protein phosphatase-4 regulatory subunit 3